MVKWDHLNLVVVVAAKLVVEADPLLLQLPHPVDQDLVLAELQACCEVMHPLKHHILVLSLCTTVQFLLKVVLVLSCALLMVRDLLR